MYARNIVFNIKNKLMPCLSGKEAHDAIIADLASNEPSMIARFGAVEIKAMLYAILPPPVNICFKTYTYTNFGRNAGFFPIDNKHLKKYGQRMLMDMRELTTLASWRPEEILLRKKLTDIPRIKLGEIGPVDTDYSWSKFLENKKVLVVHPFAESIEAQYKKREYLFHNPNVLPEFASLQTIKAVQTIAGNNEKKFVDWFEALSYMENQIESKDFDIALIGCGAYGFCLAAAVKRMGKKAVHIGGPLQLYFGIKGKRWDNYGLYNDYYASSG